MVAKPLWALFITRRSNIIACAVVTAAALIAGSVARADDDGDRFYKAVKRPTPPEVKQKELVKNPIDRFVLAKLEEVGLSLSKPADKLTLLRRVTFDLTGLPPTAEEQAEFVNDSSPAAYERVVDRLLDSPRYGEHMAQDWLDLVRYAETAGFKSDEERPDTFRYRDYVIRAFNDDLSYDRFVRQQIAGDELEPDNVDAIVATGYLRLYPEESNASNFKLCRQNILDDVTEVTGLALMGMTFGCAKCHDHKFDPILQSDFYELESFFAPLLPRNGVPIASDEEEEAHEVRQFKWERATEAVRRQLDTLVAKTKAKAMSEVIEAFDAETQRACLKSPEERTPMEQQLAALASRSVERKMDRVPGYLDEPTKKRYDELEGQLAEYDYMRPQPLPTAMAVAEVNGGAPPTFLLATGNYAKPIREVRPSYPNFLDDDVPAIVPRAIDDEGTSSSGRRTALARWLTEPDHPLVARVMVNRMWQHHFGRGIVGTANDFGLMGESPTHADLLDWLSAEFIERRWSMKVLHRLMVTSATYCQSAKVDAGDAMNQAAQAADPTNRLLWHARRMRLRGEAIRDALLQLSGELNLRMYGKSARPELPEVLMSSRYSWYADENVEDRNRRSIYVFARRNLRHPLLAAFDPPDMLNSCSRRATTVTAPQALTLLNGKLPLEQARRWSGKLLDGAEGNRIALITAAYRDAFGRRPTSMELDDADKFLTEQGKRIAADEEISGELLPRPVPKDVPPWEAAAVVDFCHALVNASEFMFVE
jgi:hypothetical protein